MILVINGTNRKGNRSQVISKYCVNYLSQFINEEVKYLTLEELNSDIISDQMYTADGQANHLNKIQDELIIPIDKWIIISPEYNGSFPGILKLFFDALSIRKYKDTFAGKKVALIGTSDGRAGNLRGMEHITSFLNYLKVTIFYNKLPISSIKNIVVNESVEAETAKTLNLFLDEFVAWSK